MAIYSLEHNLYKFLFRIDEGLLEIYKGGLLVTTLNELPEGLHGMVLRVYQIGKTI